MTRKEIELLFTMLDNIAKEIEKLKKEKKK